jgi:hypothetical protein
MDYTQAFENHILFMLTVPPGVHPGGCYFVVAESAGTRILQMSYFAGR